MAPTETTESQMHAHDTPNFFLPGPIQKTYKTNLK